MKTVCAVMLANGREAMVRRAIRAFQEQTYPAKRLLIWDTGELNEDFDTTGEADGEIAHIPAQAYRNITIGALRNEANAFWTEYPIICHFDSDDYSHPNRIAEQVALLELSGKQAVGYRDMLFWRDIGFTAESTRADIAAGDGEAWLYTNPNQRYCLGTSLCYWRETWERKPFPDLPKGRGGTGEDTAWLQGIDSLGQSSLAGSRDSAVMVGQPRMIASIHGENTMLYDSVTLAAPNFKRAPEWDGHCRKVMQL